MTQLLRFADLKARGIVHNWPMLAVLTKKHGFPVGRRLGANHRVWAEDEIEAWLAALPDASEVKPAVRGGAAKQAAAKQERETEAAA